MLDLEGANENDPFMLLRLTRNVRRFRVWVSGQFDVQRRHFSMTVTSKDFVSAMWEQIPTE
jgi:hypothetical protein